MDNSTKIFKMENLMGVQSDSEQVLGKFLYFSLPNVLVNRDELANICDAMGLPVKPGARIGLSNAFRAATGDIYERVVDRDNGEMKIHKIYCRDNQNNGDSCSRELIKETLGKKTNRYKKLANLTFNKTSDTLDYSIDSFDSAVSVEGCCEKAVELYELYKVCAGRSTLESMTENFLSHMEALKISVHGKLFFVPKKHMHMLVLFEDFIEELNKHNLRGNQLTVNSMHVIDDAKQREKMTTEFYNATRKEIELYTEKLENFIAANCQSPTIIERWIAKVEGLNEKKKHYEEILKRDLNKLDEDFDNLKFFANELSLRASKLRKAA